MTEKLITNPHAGEILKYEFLEELGISQIQLGFIYRHLERSKTP